MPEVYKKGKGGKPRGVANRNRGLQRILELGRDFDADDAVFYFADDDNSYDLELFEAVRNYVVDGLKNSGPQRSFIKRQVRDSFRFNGSSRMFTKL